MADDYYDNKDRQAVFCELMAERYCAEGKIAKAAEAMNGIAPKFLRDVERKAEAERKVMFAEQAEDRRKLNAMLKKLRSGQ